MPSELRREFDGAFDKAMGFDVENVCGIGSAFKKVQMKSALWAARWMAEIIASESEKKGFVRHDGMDYQVSKKIRQLSKELDK